MQLIFYLSQLQEVHCTDDHSEDQERLSEKEIKEQRVVAIKAVAHKLCRACYYIMKDQVPFDITKTFA
jgi:transposase